MDDAVDKDGYTAANCAEQSGRWNVALWVQCVACLILVRAVTETLNTNVTWSNGVFSIGHLGMLLRILPEWMALRRVRVINFAAAVHVTKMNTQTIRCLCPPAVLFACHIRHPWI